MRLGLVTKLDKRNMATSKNFDDDVMPATRHVIVFFPICGQFEAIRKPDFERMVYKNLHFHKQ